MNFISFKHSNQYLPPNFNFNNLKISNDFQKIYNENYVCIFGLSNIPKNINGYDLYQCKLDKYKNNIINVNILVDTIILEKLLYNSIQIPSRKLLFKLIKRNNKHIFNIDSYIQIINDNIFFLNDTKNETDLNKQDIFNWFKNIENNANKYINFINDNIIKIGNIYTNTITEEFYINMPKECYTSIKLKGGIFSINNSDILLNTIINHCAVNNFNYKWVKKNI